jgi:hypothetical protein
MRGFGGGDGAPHGHTTRLRDGLSTTKSWPAFMTAELTEVLGLGECGVSQPLRQRSGGRTKAMGSSCRCKVFLDVACGVGC